MVSLRSGNIGSQARMFWSWSQDSILFTSLFTFRNVLKQKVVTFFNRNALYNSNSEL